MSNYHFSIIYKLSIIYVSLIFIGCSSNQYNTPFIDTVETLQLKAGLNNNEVIDLLGKPLYIESGNQTKQSIFWVYEVRGREVESLLIPSTNEKIPNKDHKNIRASDPIHYLRITFINNEVNNWEVIKNKEIINLQDSGGVQNKISNKFFLLGKTGMGIHSKIDGSIIGGTIGYGNLGAEIMIMDEGNGSSIMLVYKKPYNKFSLQAGIGMTSVEWEENYYACSSSLYTSKYNCENNNKYWRKYYGGGNAQGVALRLGIGYEFHIGKHFVIKPAFEMNLGNEANSGFSGMNVNIGWQ